MENLHLFIQIALFVIILEYCVNRLSISNYRERLFSIRNELFDYTLENKGLAFNDKAYREMEQLLNGTIRFAHRIKFIDFALIAFFTNRRYPEYMKEAKVNFGKELEKSLRELKNDQARNKVKELRTKSQIALIRYLYSRSIVLILFSLPALVYYFFKEVLIAIIKRSLKKNVIKGGVKKSILISFRFPIFKTENEACLQGV
jgi:hypothetical protein